MPPLSLAFLTPAFDIPAVARDPSRLYLMKPLVCFPHPLTYHLKTVGGPDESDTSRKFFSSERFGRDLFFSV